MSIVSAFAAPHGAVTHDASRTIARRYFERTRLRLVAALGAHEALHEGLATLTPRGAAWRPEVGLSQTALSAGFPELAALQLAVIGQRNETLRTQVDRPTSLAIDGWVVPVRGQTSVETREDWLRIESDAGEVEFHGDNGRMRCDAGTTGRFWNVAAIRGRQSHYAIESRLGFAAGNFPWPTVLDTQTAIAQRGPQDASSVDTLTDAIALIGDVSPDYAEWIGNVVDGFLLANGPANYGISSPDFPGLIALSSTGGLLDYVESMMAEACHQYLFQLLLVTPLTAGGTEEIHYIPARRFYLTTRRALIAAHVHANVIAVLARVAAHPKHAAAARMRMVRRRLMLDTDCWPALERCTQLTEAGTELYTCVRALTDS